ncbi:hypothetical protein L494_4017 [Bordetella bronchiseptica CA90 BB1334]|nr:hypothetical protein L494_4017 [Bordetella bronchiseptica CA90 BB1334]
MHRRDGDVAVHAFVGPERHQALVVVAGAHAESRLGQHIEMLLGHPGRQAIEHGHLDLLPLARPAPVDQRRQDAVDHVQRRQQVRHRHPAAHRRTRRLAGHRHQARQGLHQDVHAFEVLVLAGLAKGLDRRIDDAIVDLPDTGIVHAQALRGPFAQVLDEDIAFAALAGP